MVELLIMIKVTFIYTTSILFNLPHLLYTHALPSQVHTPVPMTQDTISSPGLVLSPCPSDAAAVPLSSPVSGFPLDSLPHSWRWIDPLLSPDALWILLRGSCAAQGALW